MKKVWLLVKSFLFKRKKKEDQQNLPDKKNKVVNAFSTVSNNFSTPVQKDHLKITHIEIVLKTILKNFYERGRFTSGEIYFFTQLEGYDLTQKQVWRVVSKFNKFNYIDKVVLDSNSQGNFYVLTDKFYGEKIIKLY